MSDANSNTDPETPEESAAKQQSSADAPNPTPTTPTTQTNPPSPTSATDGLEIRKNLYRGALALFALLAVVAVIQLYGSVNATINTFISHEYRPLFRMAFNLVVLLVAGIGISWTVRELSRE